MSESHHTKIEEKHSYSEGVNESHCWPSLLGFFVICLKNVEELCASFSEFGFGDLVFENKKLIWPTNISHLINIIKI